MKPNQKQVWSTPQLTIYGDVGKITADKNKNGGGSADVYGLATMDLVSTKDMPHDPS